MSHLPERPSIAQLRKQARAVQAGVLSGDAAALEAAGLEEPPPSYPLQLAQRNLARGYGFPSWARLRRQVETIVERSFHPATAPPSGTPAQDFLRLVCLTWDGEPTARTADVVEFRAAHPDIADRSAAVAAACSDFDALARHVRRDPRCAVATTAPFGWSPLLYLACSRAEPPSRAAALACARALLDAGADPDDGRFFDGLPTPFTVLTGVLGGGEGDQPPHRYSLDLARLLLERGADPNDGQALYNRMFSVGDDWLKLLLEFGLGRGDGGPWHRRLPDLLDPPAAMVRALLGWAVVHDQRERVALLAANGVDMVNPLSKDGPLPLTGTPVQVALTNGHRELAAQLRASGVRAPALDPVDGFVAAALAGDAVVAGAVAPGVVADARRQRPGLLVWAASMERLDAVEVLLAAGWDVDAMGRSDVPVEQPWQTALHTAVERGNAALMARLLESGADRTVTDMRFDATPAHWARHFDRLDLLPLLEP